MRSAKVGSVNEDLLEVEEFEIVVELAGEGGPLTKSVSFPQYPDRGEILAKVAAAGCRRE